MDFFLVAYFQKYVLMGLVGACIMEMSCTHKFVTPCCQVNTEVPQCQCDSYAVIKHCHTTLNLVAGSLRVQTGHDPPVG